MVHFRIVVPAAHVAQVVDLLEAMETAVNLVHLRDAARRPSGDVILCDVPRQEASLLVADLRELDVDLEGSISIESGVSQVSSAAWAAERIAHRSTGEPVIWEEVSAHTSQSVELNVNFLVFMALAMLIAAVGIYFDQPILIVGAMVLGPDFGPIAGACVAVVNRRRSALRRSAVALAVGFPFGIVVTLLATLLLEAIGQVPTSIDFNAHTLTRFITDPDFFSGYVAFAAGAAGLLSLTSAKSSALVGVLISVATIPAAANMGVAAAYGEWSTFAGAAEQLVINLAAIFAGGLLALYVQRLLYVRRRHRHLSESSRRSAGLPVGHSGRRPDRGSEPEPL